jgi:hypothetical protein
LEQVVNSAADTVNLEGVIDLHVHSAPDVRPRLLSDVDVAKQAARAGMAAVLIKSHHTLTADRAALIDRQMGNLRVFGGLALNNAVGGLNPAAVETALAFGAKEIWMPTLDAANHNRWVGSAKPGIAVLGDDGQLVPAIYPILDLIAQKDVILGTGHLSVRETTLIVKAARDIGVRRILITHPALPVVSMPITIQNELAKLGVFFERCLLSARAYSQYVTIANIADAIREIGHETTVLATDFGQVNNPPPVQGIRTFIAELLGEGFQQLHVERMTKDNPRWLLGLDGDSYSQRRRTSPM